MPLKKKDSSHPVLGKVQKTLHSPAHDTFTRLMKEARQKAGLTQTETARRLGVRQNLISYIERGERLVDVIEFIHFCRVYGVNPGRFLKKMQDTPPPK